MSFRVKLKVKILEERLEFDDLEKNPPTLRDLVECFEQEQGRQPTDKELEGLKSLLPEPAPDIAMYRERMTEYLRRKAGEFSEETGLEFSEVVTALTWMHNEIVKEILRLNADLTLGLESQYVPKSALAVL